MTVSTYRLDDLLAIEKEIRQVAKDLDALGYHTWAERVRDIADKVKEVV